MSRFDIARQMDMTRALQLRELIELNTKKLQNNPSPLLRELYEKGLEIFTNELESLEIFQDQNEEKSFEEISKLL